MDACTRQRTNYFGINVQFVDDNDKICINTIAVKDTKAQHGSDFLKTLIIDVLREYDIKFQQILSIVTDNASNMKTTIDKLNLDESLQNHRSNDDNVDDEEIVIDLETEETEYIALASQLKINHMRCAAHTLQLAIRDGLKEVHATQLIGKIRNIVVILRNPKIDGLLKRKAGKGAIIDQSTRWALCLWIQIMELETLLRQPHIVTVQLQSADLTPGVFLKEWKNLIFNLSKIEGPIAEGIRSSMIRRESLLLDNDILLAAIYIDPMYRILLSEEQMIRGRKSFYTVGLRMFNNNLEDNKVAGLCESQTITETKQNQTIIEILENTNDFEQFLDDEENKRSEPHLKSDLSDNDVALFKQNFENALTLVERFNRYSKLTVKEAIPKYPKIVQNSAWAVTALPPTQVSVERLFSALKIIKSDLRASLKDDILEAILYLRTNVQ
ncbi:uncharacterized protein [Onthophagus taurus]|uniref:uncharacterized protein n=1 Tax=Onthophagus taurus TaxID=166361 RepID=UPI0039BDC2C2